MSDPKPYLLFPGDARSALNFYQSVFGGDLALHTFAEFGREDGPDDAIAHGVLEGPVTLFAADAAEGEATFQSRGLMFSLLGTSSESDLRRWFEALAEGGTVDEELVERPWGAVDGQVTDRYGLRWLVGFEKAKD